MSLSTVKHTPVVTDAHGYCNVPEPKEEMNPSTVKHTPVVTDAHSYCNITSWSSKVVVLIDLSVVDGLGWSRFGSASPPHCTSPPLSPPQMSPNDKFKAFQLSQVGPPSFPDLLPMSESSVPPPLPIMKTQLSQLTDRSTSTSTLKGKVTKS